MKKIIALILFVLMASPACAAEHFLNVAPIVKPKLVIEYSGKPRIYDEYRIDESGPKPIITPTGRSFYKNLAGRYKELNKGSAFSTDGTKIIPNLK